MHTYHINEGQSVLLRSIKAGVTEIIFPWKQTKQQCQAASRLFFGNNYFITISSCLPIDGACRSQTDLRLRKTCHFNLLNARIDTDLQYNKGKIELISVKLPEKSL